MTSNIEPGVIDGLCAHLRPLLDRALSTGARVDYATSQFGYGVRLTTEPPRPDPDGLLVPVHGDPRSHGWTYAWRCREHWHELSWGDYPGCPVSTEFQQALLLYSGDA